jgi:hypothetical protein
MVIDTQHKTLQDSERSSDGSQQADVSPSASGNKAGGPKPPARRGGGPRTAEGKRVVAQNAIKHGLTSASPVAGGESQEDWETHLEGLRKDFAPVGTIEEIKVHELASLLWRKQRAMRYEARLIDARLEAFGSSASTMIKRPPTDTEEILDKLDCDLVEAISLIECLEQLDDSSPLQAGEVCNALFLPAIACTNETLPTWLVFPSEGKTWTCSDIRRWLSALAEHLGTTVEDLRRDALAKGRAILEDRRKRRAAQERLERKGLIPEREALFPLRTDLEVILRYENAMDRMIDRTLKQLELPQRARSGELPPSPQRIEVSVN